MPKNPHPPRNGGAKKPKPSVNTNLQEDTSFIVFSDGKDKKGKKQATQAGKIGESSNTGNKGKGKPQDGAGQGAEEQPKRPDTRTLIGGASWTGKLPMNLLSEHCQKQKWGKPDYTVYRDGGSHAAFVTLSKTNPKTQESMKLPEFKLPKEHAGLAKQPTAIEARHFAAAYTLFRVASGKNLHMMMPPTYRDLWKGEFAKIKEEDVKADRGWMYEADPFTTFQEREKAIIEKAKEQERRQKEIAQKQAQPDVPGRLQGGHHGGGGDRMRGWTKVPKIELGKRMRKETEQLIRKDTIWNPHNVHLANHVRARVVSEVAALGFRRSHVEEAAEICKDREEIIEWLLIHVPEDDLPGWCLPEGYVAGVSMASSDLKREGALKRLAATGYAMELCEEVYDSQKGDEAKAAALLQARLLRPTEEVGDLAKEMEDLSVTGQWDDPTEAWDEEISSLSAIYDTRLESVSDSICRIKLEITPAGKQIALQARKPFGPYPSVLPVITIDAALPAYIRLSIIKQALLFAECNLLGAPMLFDMVDWLEQNIPSIIERPGRLTDVSSGIAAADSGEHTKQAREQSKKTRPRRPINWRAATPTSMRILSQWQAKQQTPAQQKMMSVRGNLPAWKLRAAIVETVNRNPVTIISGETGSGKSTQSVQFILDDLIWNQLGEVANIICTQPRRISALGLADRVAEERCSRVGEEVGYIIRGESKQSPGQTKITFVTTGVLLRRLQTSGGSPEDVVASLADVSHVVVDEVHERSLDTDFLLVLLRDVLWRRKDLKVILMSATLDADIFESYFRNVGSVGRVEIQGRTYPVDDYYIDDVIRFTNFGGSATDEGLDSDDVGKAVTATLRSTGMRINYDLIAETVRHIDRQLGSKDGGILIFLPGTMEIDRTLQALRQFSNLHALPLHASLMPAEQKRVFPPAPPGKRKVIAATNVAETSITIEDIVAVIDTGRVKETSFDPQNNMVRLGEVWASRAACKQRRGRAGRVRAGQCYNLYTRNVESSTMMERPEPEIRRVPLEQLCLSVKAMGIQDVPAFLAGAITPPASTAVEGAITLLSQMGALEDNELTALGKHLSMIPADLRCGKLLVYGATFGCLESALTIASMLTARSPFISPRDRNEETRGQFNRIRSSFAQYQGDLIVDLRAFEQWSTLRSKGISARDLRTWCQENSLSSQTLFDIASNRSQYLSSLKEISFIPPTYSSHNPSSPSYTSLNRHNASDALLRALIAAAVNPQIARIEFPSKKFAAGISGAVELDPEARTIKYFDPSTRLFIHPSSILFDSQGFPSNASFLAYFSKIATSKVFVREVTPLGAYALLMFGGRLEVDTLGRGLVVDGWCRVRGWARIGVLVSRLRGMLDEVLERKSEDPGLDVAGEEVVRVVRKLVELNGLDA